MKIWLDSTVLYCTSQISWNVEMDDNEEQILRMNI